MANDRHTTKLDSARLRWSSDSAYAKSPETRRAILRAAIIAFGEAGFQGATTRQIAEAAGVKQPAINYYFGDKQGLYQACAKEILTDFIGPLEEVSLRAFDTVREQGDRPGAARQLQDLLSALADVMILSPTVNEASGFVLREMREPGLAYRYLYENLWAPGIELAATLVAIIKGRPVAAEADRIDAIMMISAIAAFGPGQAVSMEVMQWRGAGARGKALVLERLTEQIEGWLARGSD